MRWVIGILFALGVALSATAAEWHTQADVRERYQWFDNFDFNAATGANGWEFDSRLYLRLERDFGARWHALIQPQAVIIAAHSGPRGTVQLSQADLLQAWVQYVHGRWALRLGRQQLVYGDQRLIGHLGWKDVARTFDGLKLRYDGGAWAIDAFAVHPADIVAMTPTMDRPHGSALVTWEDRRLMGVYTHIDLEPQTGIELYGINWHHNAHASAAPGRNVHTIGSRIFAQFGGLDGTAEAAFQRGTWLPGIRQQASAYAVKAGYTFAFWHTRLGIEYDFSPGDDKRDPLRHKDFVFPFHTNHMHYGEMDRFSWGNMRDFRLSLRTSPQPGLTLAADIHWFALDQATGDWLNVVGTAPLFAGQPGYVQTDAGHEVDLKLSWRPSAVSGLTLNGLFGWFAPGAAVVERNGGHADRARFAYLFGRYVF